MFDDKFNDSPLSELLSAASEIDGIDIRLALSRISGKQNVLEAALEQTADLMDEKLRKMDMSLSAADLRNFSIEAHGLKNAFVGIGAVKQSELASELEEAARDGNALFCEVKFPKFADSSVCLAAKLKATLPQNDSKGGCRGDAGFLLRMIGETIEFLNCFEADDALNCMESLGKFTYGEEMDALLSHIRSKIKSFKYDEAVFLLKTLIM